jgi:hypothetical protein
MAGRGVLSGGRGSNQNSAYDSPRVDLPQWPSAQPPFFGVKQLPPVVAPPATPSGATPTFSVDWTASSTIPSQITTARSSAANYYNSSGVRTSATSGTARIDYIPGTLDRAGLLAEEQRTNIYLRSDDAWNGTGVVNPVNGTIAQSAVNGADGTTKLALLQATASGNSQCFAYQNPTMTSGATYTYSADVKLQDKNQIGLLAGSSTTNVYATVIFDFTTGKITQTAVGSAGGTLLNTFVIPLPNGIYRVGLTASMANANSWIVEQAGAATGNTFAANGTVTYTTIISQGILFGGMMVELGASPTSHIVTTTASVTRSADIFSSTDSTLLAAKGWIAEVGEIPVSSAKTFVGVNTVIGIGEDTNNLFTTTDGGTLTTIYGASDPGPVRAGFAWDSTPRVAISSGGSSALTAANTAVTPTTLYFGNTNNGASGFLNGHIRMLASYSALDDTQLAYLTPPGTSFTISGGAVTGDGSAAGSGTATAIGTAIVAAVGSSAGSGTASGIVVGLSSTDKNASINVSADGLTASLSSDPGGDVEGRGNSAGVASGIFEVAFSAITSGLASSGSGIANSTQSLSVYTGSPNGMAYYGSGFYEGPGSVTGSAATYTTGDVITWELLASSAKVYKNGTLQVTFTTLPSGSLYPIVSLRNSGDSATFNFGAKAFAYLPAGDTGWNGLTPSAGSVGSASGSGAATAVGASTASSQGASSGSATVTAVGASTARSSGSAAGSGAATAVGASTAAAVGSAAGSGAATAVGASTARSIGAAAGSGAATAVGASTAASVGSAAGSGPATAVGASTAASVGSSSGSGTATAASVSSAVGSAAGTGSASAVGIASAAAVGSVTGSGTATAVGSATAAAIGASAGSGTATAIGASTAQSIGSASGSSTAAAFTGIVAQAAGSGTASAVGASTAAAIGASAGTGTATAASSSSSISSAVGASSGSGTATAIGASVRSAVGSSSGSGTASGVGTTVGVTTVVSAIGTAAGSSTSIGYAPSIDFSDDFGDDFANLLGTLPEQIDFGDDFSDDFAVRHIVRPITEDFSDDFSSDFAVHHGIQRIVSGVGVSAGASIVAGTITTDVVTPPVYPAPPPPIPLVWHPAHEYRRVQAPRAVRIHRHGTELRKATPRSMKRRYG